ncbi:MAG: hypothetical protein JWO78_2168 [Micavibrio sp.]|nr:hypothetical protein [Micavibrio sp.]
MNSLLRFALLLSITTCATFAYAAEDRMTGRQPGAPLSAIDEKVKAQEESGKIEDPKPEVQKKDPRGDVNNIQPKFRPPAVNTPQPKTGTTMDQKSLESLGPLTNPLKGGLGDDMWTGTSRSLVQDFLPRLPVGNTLPMVQWLTRRVLLSNGDTSSLRGDKSVSGGDDIFTLRLEKLLEMGAYSDAVDLYTLIEGEPSHDRLARAGVIALLSRGLPAQACLEAAAAHRGKAETPDSDSFWTQIDAACLYIQSESVRKLKDSAAAFASPVASVPGSKVLTTLVNRPEYRYSISSPADLEELSVIERAVLRGIGRFDYSRLGLRNLAEISGPALMIMAGDPNVPAGLRLRLNYEAAERGLLDDEGLGAVYEEIAKQNQPTVVAANAEPSNSIEGRYIAALKPDAEGAERNSIVAAQLENLQGEQTTALLPFANWVPSVNPANLSAHAVRNGLKVMLQNGMTPPARWVNAWLKGQSGDSVRSGENFTLYLANLVPENLPTESIPFPEDSLKRLFASSKPAENIEIYSVFAGLGRLDALHNTADQAIYEKHIDLTLENDYVMPIDSLVDKLREAAKNDRLGETVLLAAVALKEYDPAKTHPGVLQEVLKSLETVGLKEEARAVAVEVILSLKQ